jgi:hypothetical protein
MDWAQAAADLALVRADNQISIVIRRGATTLAAQSVRIARTGAGSRQETNQTEEARGRVVVLFGTSGDVAPEDRFNDGAGVLYRVVIVRPNRRAGIMAEAEVVE